MVVLRYRSITIVALYAFDHHLLLYFVFDFLSSHFFYVLVPMSGLHLIYIPLLDLRTATLRSKAVQHSLFPQVEILNPAASFLPKLHASYMLPELKLRKLRRNT